MPARLHCIVIGLGNPDRGDDGAGPAVARGLQGSLPPGIEVVADGGDAASIIDSLEGADAAILVDACVSHAPAGTVQRFDAAKAPLPADAFPLSTHGLGLAEAIELARILGDLPPRCVVYAIAAESVEPGAPLSSPVAAAIGEVCARIRAELAEMDAPQEGRHRA